MELVIDRVVRPAWSALRVRVLPKLKGKRRKLVLIAVAAVCALAFASLFLSEPPQVDPASPPVAFASVVAREQTMAQPTSQPTTKPTTRPTAQSPWFSLSFFEPTSEDAEETWLLPANLSTAEVRELVTKVDKLQASARRLAARVQAQHDDIEALGAADVRDALWRRLCEKGFKDTRIPALYHKALQDEMWFFAGVGQQETHNIERAAFGMLDNRIRAVQVRLFGGRCLMADTLFVDAAQRFLDGRHSQLDVTEPARTELLQRLGSEMPAFTDFHQQVLANQNPLMRLPHSDGYQRLPGAVND